MARLAFGPLGVVMALFPDAVLEAFEDVALENPEECTANPYIVPAIRAEGAVYALASVVGGRTYRWLLGIGGVAGVVVALFPDRYLEFGAELAYENPEDVAWNDDFVTAVRVLGVVLVLLALNAARPRGDGTDEEPATQRDEPAEADA